MKYYRASDSNDGLELRNSYEVGFLDTDGEPARNDRWLEKPL